MKRSVALLALVSICVGIVVLMVAGERWLPAPRQAERRPQRVEAKVPTPKKKRLSKQVQLRSSMALRGRHGDPDPAQEQYFPVHKNGPKQLNGERLMPTEIEGTFDPRMLMASDVDIPSDQEIIGLVAGGEFRAYLVEAVAIVQDHVLNQWIGGRAVSLTYCNQTDCARVFTSNVHREAIDLRVGGLVKTDRGPKLVLMLDGKRYEQDSAVLPLVDYMFERLSWGDWLASHPETTVFIGEMKRFEKMPL